MDLQNNFTKLDKNLQEVLEKLDRILWKRNFASVQKPLADCKLLCL